MKNHFEIKAMLRLLSLFFINLAIFYDIIKLEHRSDYLNTYHRATKISVCFRGLLEKTKGEGIVPASYFQSKNLNSGYGIKVP